MDQESDLENWARKNGCWHIHPQEYFKSLGYQFYGFGGEAQVYAEGDVFVHKVCRTGQYNNLVRFFDRIVIQNTLCPQASLEVEGFGRDLQNDFVVLMKQRFFRQSHKMSEDEISLYMRCLGFWKLVEEPYLTVRFYSDTVIAEMLDCGHRCYLNPDTNETIFTLNPGSWEYSETPNEDAELLERVDSWERRITLTPPESYESFRFMEGFVDELPEGESSLRGKLIAALSNNHPFARFKAVIDSCPYRQGWFAYKQRCLEAYVKDEISEAFKKEEDSINL